MRTRRTTKDTKLVPVNALGSRIGEDHPNAKWTNEQVDLVFELRDKGWGYKRIVNATGMPKRTVRDICNGRRRCQYADHWKRVPV